MSEETPRFEQKLLKRKREGNTRKERIILTKYPPLRERAYLKQPRVNKRIWSAVNGWSDFSDRRFGALRAGSVLAAKMQRFSSILRRSWGVGFFLTEGVERLGRGQYGQLKFEDFQTF